MTRDEKLKEWRRKDNARRSKAKRQWERENRAKCPKCGSVMAMGSKGRHENFRLRPKRCRPCFQKESEERLQQAISFRKEGFTNDQIGDFLDLADNTVANMFYRAKRRGIAIPPSPYWSRAA